MRCRSTRPARPSRPSLPAKSGYVPRIVLAYFRDSWLPTPDVEYYFAKPRKWRFDFAWPAYRVALEVEGGAWVGGAHTRGKHFLEDMEKYNTAAALGWRLLRCVPKDLCMMQTIELIKRTLEAKP